MKAISIRPPWWWFILNTPEPQRKGIENRKWPAPRELLGRNILIHAAKACTHREWDEAIAFAVKCGVTMFPDFETIDRGGIVGMVKLTACVRRHPSPWFCGPFGHVFENPYPLPFKPLVGQQGYFEAMYV